MRLSSSLQDDTKRIDGFYWRYQEPWLWGCLIIFKMKNGHTICDVTYSHHQLRVLNLAHIESMTTRYITSYTVHKSWWNFKFQIRQDLRVVGICVHKGQRQRARVKLEDGDNERDSLLIQPSFRNGRGREKSTSTRAPTDTGNVVVEAWYVVHPLQAYKRKEK